MRNLTNPERLVLGMLQRGFVLCVRGEQRHRYFYPIFGDRVPKNTRLVRSLIRRGYAAIDWPAGRVVMTDAGSQLDTTL